MKNYIVNLARVYKVTAKNVEEAKKQAIKELEHDIKIKLKDGKGIPDFKTNACIE